MAYPQTTTTTRIIRKPLNGTDTRHHVFSDQDAVWTAWREYTSGYVAWLDNQDGEQDQVQGHGSTRLEAIADLAQQIREAE